MRDERLGGGVRIVAAIVGQTQRRLAVFDVDRKDVVVFLYSNGTKFEPGPAYMRMYMNAFLER